MKTLKEALVDPKWINHRIGDLYSMDGKPGWKIAYYPIFEDGRTGNKYDEPRALVENPIEGGTDFREVPLRYLTKINWSCTVNTRGSCISFWSCGWMCDLCKCRAYTARNVLYTVLCDVACFFAKPLLPAGRFISRNLNNKQNDTRRKN